MPYSTSTGVYTPASGATTATAGQVIASATWNGIFNDMTTAFTQLGQGTFAPPSSVLTLVNGLNSNITLTATLRARVAGPTGAFSVGGFTGGADGLRLYLYNNVAQTMTIVNEDASSTATNRIKTNTGGNIVLQATSTSFVTMSYDGTAGRWVVESVNGIIPNAVAPSGATTSRYLTATAQAVNFAASASDIATFTIPLPVSISNYQVNNMRVYNAAATLGAITVSLYTGAGATGFVVIGSVNPAVTTAAVNTAGAVAIVQPSVSTFYLTATTLFLHVSTSLATSSTANVALEIFPLF